MTKKRIDKLFRLCFWGLASGIIGEHFGSVALTIGLVLIGLALVHGDD